MCAGWKPARKGFPYAAPVGSGWESGPGEPVERESWRSLVNATAGSAPGASISSVDAMLALAVPTCIALNMRVVVTGAGGLLGRAVVCECRRRGVDVIPTDAGNLDVTRPDQTRAVLDRERPDWVVHCAAFTSVDAAEEREEEALRVNRDGTRIVLEAADRVEARILFPSTDYIFDGAASRPYRTDDPPRPLGAYGRSKLEGEEVVRRAGGAHIIVRTSWLYGSSGGNFVDSMLRLGRERGDVRVVSDQIGRPTWSASLARGLLDLVSTGAEGTFHLSDDGSATWAELARAIFELSGMRTRVVPVTTEEWGAKAPRPRYSVLDLEPTIALVGSALPHWRSSLASYLGVDS